MNPYTYREKVFMIIIVVCMIGIIAIEIAAKETIKEYQKPYIECMRSLDAAERGLLPVWDGTGINERVTNINYTYK